MSDPQDIEPFGFPRVLLSDYEPLDILGHGSTGTVFLARNKVTDVNVALKVLRSPSREDLARFRQEASTLERFDDPGIPKLLASGFSSEVSFLALEYIPGNALSDSIGAPVSDRKEVDLMVKVLIQVCKIVCVAHRDQVVHRDLKPTNILLGDGRRVVVLDFGSSKEMAAIGDHTVSGTVIGSPRYMSPEQIGGMRVDPRTDVWSAGVVLYECLVGALPFRGATFLDIKTEIMRGELRRPSRANRAIPRALDRVIEQALSVDRERRYARMRDFCEDLQRYVDRVPVHARKRSFASRWSHRIRRHPAVASLLMGVFLLMGVSLYLFGVNLREQEARLRPYQALVSELAKKNAQDSFGPGSLAFLQWLIAHIEQWDESYPELSVLQATVLLGIGDRLQEQGRVEEAHAQNLRALEKLRPWEGDVENSDFLSLLSIALVNVGDGTTEYGPRLAFYEEAYAIDKRLASRDGAEASKNRLCYSMERTANLLALIGNRGAALKRSAEHVDYARKMVDNYRSPGAKYALCSALRLRIDLCERAREIDGAVVPDEHLELLLLWRNVAAELVHDFPDNAECRFLLAGAWRASGVVHNRAFDHAKACDDLKAARDLFRECYEKNPSVLKYLSTYCETCVQLSDPLFRAGRREEAIDQFDLVLSALDKAARTDGSSLRDGWVTSFSHSSHDWIELFIEEMDHESDLGRRARRTKDALVRAIDRLRE